MSSYVIDTQALVKLLTGTSRIISQEVDQVLRDADLGLNRIIIPSVVIFEVAYLHEKGRIPISVRNLRCLLEDACNYIEAPLSIRIIECAFEIKDIPEIHDRLIVGTARYMGIPILTNDPVIRSSKFVTCV